MASGEKPVPLKHAATIETFTSGEVTRKDLRPNDWQRIWPELADQASANQVI
jgi:DNA-binding transcriptional regulator YdaS (Cro superfamily)